MAWGGVAVAAADAAVGCETLAPHLPAGGDPEAPGPTFGRLFPVPAPDGGERFRGAIALWASFPRFVELLSLSRSMLRRSTCCCFGRRCCSLPLRLPLTAAAAAAALRTPQSVQLCSAPLLSQFSGGALHYSQYQRRRRRRCRHRSCLPPALLGAAAAGDHLKLADGDKIGKMFSQLIF